MTDLPTVPLEGQTLNLDALEAQRREGNGQALKVTWRGHDYLLPVELPMEAIDQLATMADVEDVAEDAEPAVAAAAMRKVSRGLDGGLAVLFCTCPALPEKAPHKPKSHPAECQWPKFCGTRPSLATRMALVNGAWAAYGVSLGEALAPAEQSATGGRRSVQTSNGSTGSTSETSTAGVKAPADRLQPKRPPAKKAAAKRAAPRRKPAAE